MSVLIDILAICPEASSVKLVVDVGTSLAVSVMTSDTKRGLSIGDSGMR
jgi:hypothetical protein